MWFVYILECRDRSFYTGISNGVEARLRKHQMGKGGRYTRTHLPVSLIYAEKCRTRSRALKRELEIKRLSRKQKEDLIRRQAL